jgi:hypothetical protein
LPHADKANIQSQDIFVIAWITAWLDDLCLCCI